MTVAVLAPLSHLSRVLAGADLGPLSRVVQHIRVIVDGKADNDEDGYSIWNKLSKENSKVQHSRIELNKRTITLRVLYVEGQQLGN